MKMKRVWILLVIILLLVACGGKEEMPTSTPEPQATQKPAESPPVAESDEVEKTVVRLALLDFEQMLYGDLIDSFEEENPDIDIKVVSIEETLGLESLTQEWPEDATRRLVSAADVSSYFYSGQAVRDHLLLDLAPLMEADPNFDATDFYPHVLEYFQSQGGTWGLPISANYQLLFYDKDAFDEAGLAYPEAGWTWDDFLADAQALTIREGDETSQWGFVEPSPSPSLMLQALTGPLFDMSADPPEAMLDDPAVAEALNWYSDLYLTQEVAPYYPEPDADAPGLNLPEGMLTIEAGQAAMWPEASTTYPYRSQQSNVGVVPFPADTPDAATNALFPSGVAISVGTGNPEAAWRWIDYLSRQSTDLGAFFGGASTLPARRSTAEASGFWDEVSEELGAAIAYAADHAFTPNYPEGGSEAISDAFKAVINGEKTAEEALADAQIAAEEAIAGASSGETEPGEAVVVQQGEEEELASENAVTVEFVSISSLLGMQGYRDLAKQFLTENPDIVVELKQPDLTSGLPTMTDVAATSDCFEWFPENFNDPDTQAAILSLDPFLDADADISREDFYPVVFDAFSAQGQTWGLPAQINVSLVEYNKEVFDTAGVAYPSPDWTIDEFLEKAVALTQGEGETKQYGYLPSLFEPADMITMLDRFGLSLVDFDSDPPALQLDSPAIQEAIRWYASLTTEYGVKPVLLTSVTGQALAAVQERETLLNEGRAAMWVSSAFDVDFSEEGQRGYATGAVPLPRSSGDALGSGYQSASGYFISADSELREACWQWLKYLTEQPAVGQGYPARRAVAESEAYRQQVGAELAEAYQASVASANQPPFSQQIADENSWLNYPIFWLYGAYESIINGELGVEEALADAQAKADEYRACVIAAEAYTDDEVQKACMLEIDETLPPIIFAASE